VVDERYEEIISTRSAKRARPYCWSLMRWARCVRYAAAAWLMNGGKMVALGETEDVLEDYSKMRVIE